MMMMKVAHSGCSDPRQIQDGTDTCQGHKLRVHGTRSHNPRSIPAKCPWLRFVVIFYVCLFLLQVLFICLCFLWSPESSEAPEQHCVHRRRRCKRRQTSGPPPWRSLASVEPASEKTWLLTAIWKTLAGLEVSSFETWEECETRAWRLMCCVLESFQS